MSWVVPQLVDVQVDAAFHRVEIRYVFDRAIPADGRVLHLLVTGTSASGSPRVGFGVKFVNGSREDYYLWGGSHHAPESDLGGFQHDESVVVVVYSGSWTDELGLLPVFTAATFSDGYPMQSGFLARSKPDAK